MNAGAFAMDNFLALSGLRTPLAKAIDADTLTSATLLGAVKDVDAVKQEVLALAVATDSEAVRGVLASIGAASNSFGEAATSTRASQLEVARRAIEELGTAQVDLLRFARSLPETPAW